MRIPPTLVNWAWKVLPACDNAHISKTGRRWWDQSKCDAVEQHGAHQAFSQPELLEEVAGKRLQNDVGPVEGGQDDVGVFPVVVLDQTGIFFNSNALAVITWRASVWSRTAQFNDPISGLYWLMEIAHVALQANKNHATNRWDELSGAFSTIFKPLIYWPWLAALIICNWARRLRKNQIHRV